LGMRSSEPPDTGWVGIQRKIRREEEHQGIKIGLQ